MIAQGSGMRYQGGMEGEVVVSNWRRLLGERAVLVNECTQLPEIIVSLLERFSNKNSTQQNSSPFLEEEQIGKTFIEEQWKKNRWNL